MGWQQWLPAACQRFAQLPDEQLQPQRLNRSPKRSHGWSRACWQYARQLSTYSAQQLCGWKPQPAQVQAWMACAPVECPGEGAAFLEILERRACRLGRPPGGLNNCDRAGSPPARSRLQPAPAAILLRLGGSPVSFAHPQSR